MGTRGLYCAVVDGEIKVAQYGQWDAYPENQGKAMLNFVRGLVGDDKIEDFKTALRALVAPSIEELKRRSEEQGESFFKENPQFSRDTCASVMALILDGSVKEVHLQTEFAADSLFCEWAYVIDMDRGVLEVFRGFQEKEHTQGRFAAMVDKENGHRQEKYYPVAEVAQFDFRALPDDNTFVAICEGNVLDQLANLPPS